MGRCDCACQECERLKDDLDHLRLAAESADPWAGLESAITASGGGGGGSGDSSGGGSGGGRRVGTLLPTGSQQMLDECAEMLEQATATDIDTSAGELGVFHRLVPSPTASNSRCLRPPPGGLIAFATHLPGGLQPLKNSATVLQLRGSNCPCQRCACDR